MPTQRDIDTAIGMFIAYGLLREMIADNKTAVDLIADAAGLDNTYVEMLYDIAANHADSQLEAVQEVESRLPEGHRPYSRIDRNKAIKQSMVMAAISEGNLARQGMSFGSIDLEGTEDLPLEDRLKLVTNGLDPHMIQMMADVIVSESYPNELPVRDVLMALWVEGFVVSLLAEEILEINKDDPRVQHTYVVAQRLFGELD